MRKLSAVHSSLWLILFSAVGLAACATAQEAKILKIVGNASAVSITGASGPVRQGMTLPVNSRLVTGAGVEVYVEAVAGVVATIKQNSEVTVASIGIRENRTLDLRRGSVVSQVDAKRIRKDTYGVKTPRGVAAARGTVYTVTVNGQDYTILSASGTVTVTPVGGAPGSGITIGPGGVSISSVNGGAPSTAAQIAANPTANAAVIEAAAMAVSAVAVVASDPGSFGSASAAAALELTQTVTTIVEQLPQAVAQSAASGAAAAPSQATAIVSAAVNAAIASGTSAQVAQTVAQAASQGAASTTTTPEGAAALAQAIAQAAATAAATAVPGQAVDLANGISQAAALGAVQGAIQSGQSANSVGTAIASGAAAGAAQGASSVVPSQASNIAGASSQGGAQGATNAGSTNVDGTSVSNSAASGASAGSNTTVVPPSPPTLQAPPAVAPEVTPVTPIDPTVNVSTSS